MATRQTSSRPRLLVGLMSGTSVDAIDAALVEIRGTAGRYTARVLQHLEHRWPPSLFHRLHQVMAPAQATTEEICALNFLVAREFASAVQALLRAARIKRSAVDAIGSHGQTICHLPPAAGSAHNRKSKIKNQKSPTPSTLQLGDVSVLAALTGIRTVGNFRPADMAVGGQGAPLVPFADALLLRHATMTRIVQNIGGIANLTFLPPRTRRHAAGDKVLAFDTGPGNMLLDAIAFHITRGKQRFDRNGRLAAAGRLDMNLLRQLQRHPYFARRPPKSTGREDFGILAATRLYLAVEKRHAAQQGWKDNLLHTATRLTAWSIADAYRCFLPRMPDEVILCGGGVENPVLISMLRQELAAPITLRRIDEFGIPNKAKEAVSFALLAAATLDGVPGNLPSVTGARRAVVLGTVATPQ